MPTDIRHLDLTLPSPAANLACDEALLNDREAHDGPGVLRFWNSSAHFIVVGYAARVAAEVDLAACARLGLPILRRCSGGGTVLQGPGCLSYSLILPLHAVGPAPTITDTNRFVMARHQAALQSLLQQPVAVAGHTDLVLGDRKFSGNAQRRKRAWFLFHGTFLLNLNLALLAQTLRPPPRQPDYRRDRSHLDFVTQLPVSPEQVKETLRRAWAANTPWTETPGARPLAESIEALVRDRYARDDWNRRQNEAT